jgi:hypothetical protein
VCEEYRGERLLLEVGVSAKGTDGTDDDVGVRILACRVCNLCWQESGRMPGTWGARITCEFEVCQCEESARLLRTDSGNFDSALERAKRAKHAKVGFMQDLCYAFLKNITRAKRE